MKVSKTAEIFSLSAATDLNEDIRGKMWIWQKDNQLCFQPNVSSTIKVMSCGTCKLKMWVYNLGERSITFGLINQEIGAGMSGTMLAFSFFSFPHFVFTRAKKLGVWLYTRLTELINTLRIMEKGKARINPVVLDQNWKYENESMVLNIQREWEKQIQLSVFVCVCVYEYIVSNSADRAQKQ